MELTNKTLEAWIDSQNIEVQGSTEITWNDNAHIIHVTVAEEQIATVKKQIEDAADACVKDGTITADQAAQIKANLFVTEFELEGF